MSFLEGSDSSEDADFSGSEETQGETEDTENTDTDDSGESQTEDQDNTGSTEDSTLKDQETKKTEKGTKLDSDPMSALNQQLANERAKIRQYESVLNDPNTLRNYVKQFDEKETKQDKQDEPEMRIEDIKTTEDLHKYQRQEKAKIDSKLKELDSTIAGVKSSQQTTAIASRITNDIVAVRNDYPDLNPKSDSYNPELDKAIGAIYEKVDLDPQTKTFRGSVSIKEIADIVMQAAGASKQRGTAEAQTTIRDKRTGKAVSGASRQAPDESGMTAGQIIANRIKKARGGR